MPLKIPHNIDISVEAHKKWLRIVDEARHVIENDLDLQRKAAKGFRLKERALPPEVLGRTYAQYCNLINRMYEAYLSSVHVQRAPYIKQIISVFMKRLFELRNELVHLIINDYVYVDASLIQMQLTPAEIEIVIPYHLAIEAREDSIEELFQTMWAEAVARRNAPPPQETSDIQEESILPAMASFTDSTAVVTLPPVESVHTIVTEEFIQANIIQKHERFRQFFIVDFTAKYNKRQAYYVDHTKSATKCMKTAAAVVIQKVFRRWMELKRQHVMDRQLDLKLGLIQDPWRPRLTYEDENRKLYEFRRGVNENVKQTFLKELEQENLRLIRVNKDNQIEDISGYLRTWFIEWYLDFGFFPDYPYPVEGGSIILIRGEYPTAQEKKDEDLRLSALTKGKTKDMLKAERKQAKIDAKNKEEIAKENKRKEAEQEFKMKQNPFSDLGYKVQMSEHMQSLIVALQDYNGSWSIYDTCPPQHYGEVIYGFMKPLLTEDLMCQLHKECRKIVDDFMRQELKLFVAAHQLMYKQNGKTYPKLRPRQKPKVPPVPKPLKMDDAMMATLEEVFDLNVISRPTGKIKDIIGDSNYSAYDFNIRDPDATFPPPGYGDIRNRLTLSCVLGSGVEPGAARKRSVLLLGPPRHGKSFLVDCVAGELNAVKIDITPEVFSAVVARPVKALIQVFTAARVFQPCVIFLKNIERVFGGKVPPEEKYLKAKTIKTALVKCVKAMALEDKIIFIATCSVPFNAAAGPMTSLFDETILVPRTDYNTAQSFFYYKLQSIRSMERDYCVQALAQLTQGYGIGAIIKTFDEVMTPERIVRLNVSPIQPIEFVSVLMDGAEMISVEDYKEYEKFFIEHSPLSKGRAEFEIINRYRKDAYMKMAKKMAEEARKAEKNKANLPKEE